MKNNILYISSTIVASVAILTPIAVTSCNNNITNENDTTQSGSDLSSKVDEFQPIVATPSTKQKVAYGWRIEDIVDENFSNIPKSGNGIMVKILSVDNYPNKEQIDITIQFSTLKNDHISIVTETRVYQVTGFRKETIEEKVERIYGNVNITPTREAIQIPAIEENWKIEDINDNNFKGLPKSTEGVEAKLVNLGFDDSDPLQGKIILTYEFSIYQGFYSINKDFVVEGFEKASYNSNVAAQNHYKLVALYRMVDVKENVDKLKINTEEIEEGGIKKVKELFELPEDRQYNVVTLLDVISSKDNTMDTYQKGQNMDLGSVKLKFSIFDWVNNNRSVVETTVFTGFENPLSYWDELFKKATSARATINDSLFSFDKFYDTSKKYSTTTHDDITNTNILNGTNTIKQGFASGSSYLLPLADWVGYKKSSYSPSSGHGESFFGMKNISPDHSRFVNMITYDAKNNYIGNGPDKSNDLVTPIKEGGVSEILRKYIFDNVKNQELYKYDWIVFNKLVEPSYADRQLSWSSYEQDGIPFGYYSVWVNTTYEYDVWLDYTKTTIKFNVSLGMLDKAKNNGTSNGWIIT